MVTGRQFEVSYRAFENVADGDKPMAPNPTPTASPSGILWTVMAMISINILFH